jgi:aminoglycoside phosphotransferase (APT) family kinase protein
VEILSAPTADRVSTELRRWLGARFGGEIVEAEPATMVAGGFDFWIYFVHLDGPCLPAHWAAPLVVRIPPTPQRFDSIERESRLQAWASDQGFAAPRVLEVVPPGELFESPVQVMHRAAGDTMLARMTAGPWAIPRLLDRLAAQQARLHALGVPEWARTDDWSVVARRLALVRIVLEQGPHAELESALKTVERLIPSLGVEPVLCHGDFHPMNILVNGADTAVIDWTDAGIGDHHCDVARTVWLFRFAAVASVHRGQRAVLRTLAPWLAHRYLAEYRRRRSIDPDKLRRWTSVHLLHAWAMFVADEMQLKGPSRAGQDFRAGLASWAKEQFLRSTEAP